MKYTFLLISDSSPKINFADNKTVFNTAFVRAPCSQITSTCTHRSLSNYYIVTGFFVHVLNRIYRQFLAFTKTSKIIIRKLKIS